MRFSLFYVNYCLFFCSSSIVAHSSIVRFDYCLTIVTWQWRTNEWNPHTAVCVCVTLCDVMHSLCALWPLWKTLNKFYECPDITMSIVITLSFMLWLLNFNTCLSLIALSDFFSVELNFNVINCVILCQMDEHKVDEKQKAKKMKWRRRRRRRTSSSSSNLEM